MPGGSLSHQEFDKLKEDLNGHFNEELKCKQKLGELESKMESTALHILQKKNEILQVAREKGKDSISVKMLQEDARDYNSSLADIKNQAEH